MSDPTSDLALARALDDLRRGEIVRITDGACALDVLAFREKPEQESSYISGGFMVLNRRGGDYIDPEDSCSFEKAPLERLANAGQLKAHCHDGFWQCMDTYREQQLLEGLWRSGNAPWKVW